MIQRNSPTVMLDHKRFRACCCLLASRDTRRGVCLSSLDTRLDISAGDCILISYHLDSGYTTHVGLSGPLIFLGELTVPGTCRYCLIPSGDQCLMMPILLCLLVLFSAIIINTIIIVTYDNEDKDDVDRNVGPAIPILITIYLVMTSGPQFFFLG